MVRKIIAIAVLILAAIMVRQVISARAEWIGLRDRAARIGSIDYYGLGHIAERDVESRLRLKVGDPVPLGESPNLLKRVARRLAGIDSTESVEWRLREIPGVARASVQSIVEDDRHRASLFIGISDTLDSDSSGQPTGKATLPTSVAGLFRQHSEAFGNALANRNPDFDEDDSAGHAIFTDPQMHMLEERAIEFDRSAVNLRQAREVLHTAADNGQRECAAWLVSYAPDKKAVVDDLNQATRDPDEEVRNTVTRAIILISDFGNHHPDLRIRIEPARFVVMLNSLSWLDRDKSMGVLYSLAETRDKRTLDELREGGLPALTEMAHWKSTSYAEDAFKLIGRIAGLIDEEIEAAWKQGNAWRERVIQMAKKTA